MAMRKFSTATKRHLRQYNPFIEFKTDMTKTMDKHFQMTNTIMDKHFQMTNTIMRFTIAGFGALGGGLVMLYQKTEIDKKELNAKIDNNTKDLNDKIDSNTKELNDKLDTKTKELNDKLDTKTKELNDKLDTKTKELNDKLDLILMQMHTEPSKSWF